MVYSDIRARAREMLRDHWGEAIAVTFVAALMGGGLVGAGFNFNMNIGAEALADLPASLQGIILAISSIMSLLAIGQFVVGGAVQLGNAVYFLKRYHRQETQFSDLFSQFFRFGQGFLQKFLCGLYIFFWTLLFIVPGIIKTYSYAMTPFILADNPNLSAKEAITRSRELMNGHKWQLFVLDLTFIGWNLLGTITFGIGMLWVTPYTSAAHAAFYREIAGYSQYSTNA